MLELSSRERVLMALEHREPDRVPTALWGGPYGLVDELYLELLDYFELGDPVDRFRQGHTITYLDDRVLERLGVDTRYVWPGEMPSSPQQETDDPDVFLDGFGQAWRRALPYYYTMEGILAEADSGAMDKLVQWPDPNDPRWTNGAAERAAHLRQHTDAFVIARQMTSHGPFQTACDLRGTERFLMDLVEDPDYARRLVDKVTEIIDGLNRAMLEACGENIDMIELPGDDYAGNENLIISPAMFREFFKPGLRRMVETIKSFREDLRVMFHSDGMIDPLLPELIDIGVDVVHPLEPVEAMDLSEINEKFGDEIAFLGGVDIQGAMRGDRSQVETEVKERIRQLGPGGGYVLAPSNHLQADVPVENVITLFEAAQEYGRYPLSI
ncbi:MAG: uroporphyrinogen decarboxylase family protein [Anaerolineales bacterium]